MASDQTLLNLMGRALWDARPTVSDLRARQLAAALGYPLGWRVVRQIVACPKEEKAEKAEECKDDSDGPMPPPPPPTPPSSHMIVDRIYAGRPDTGCDMWFHHEAAMQAAATWDDEKSTPFDYNGGHMLPRQPLFRKGDQVQVLYDNEWWEAKILRRKDQPNGFSYQVHYTADNSRQSGVDEALIRERPADKNPELQAIELGLGPGWQAYNMGKHKWKIIAPDGTLFGGKRAALEAFQQQQENKPPLLREPLSVGDPPWRTTGSDYIGRYIKWRTEHRVSARRTIAVEQIGQVVGWISETDVDKAGEPGFVSDRTGKPARLYSVAFVDDPGHPHPSYQVASQDLEEDELLECLLPEDECPPKKKARRT